MFVFFLWFESCTDCYLPIWKVLVEWYFLHLTLLLERFFFVPLWFFEWRGFFVSFDQMDIPLSGSDTSFDISRQLLVASNSDYSFTCRYLHAQVELVDDCLEFVNEATTEDCIVGVVHFYNIEGNRFRPWV